LCSVYSKSKPKLGVWLYCLATFLLVISACAPSALYKKKKPSPSPETVRAMKRFEMAEHLFGNQSYQEALSIYQEYLKNSPKGTLADTALIETGLIYMAIGDYLQARKAFQHVLSDFKRSPLLEEARFNIILTYYRDGNYQSAIQYAGSVLKLAKTRNQSFRIYNLLGYAHNATKEFKDAVISYMDAHRLSPPEKQPEIVSKVKEIIPFLKEPELESLVDMFGSRVPGGYLRLQLAREYASHDHIKPALKVLSEFSSLFPDHTETKTAVDLTEEVKSRSLVDRFLVGCILPLSGPYEAFGQRALTGIELAISLFNAQSHIHPIQLVVKDSQANPKEAIEALENLTLERGVIGVVGPMITSESVAIRAQSLKVPIITLTQKPKITTIGDYVFRDFLTPFSQVRTIVDYAVNDLGIEKFAVLYPDEPYGFSLMNQFWDELIGHNVEMVGVESYLPTQTDFNDEIKKLVGLYYPRPEKLEEEQETNQAETWETFFAYEVDQFIQSELKQFYQLPNDSISDQKKPGEQPQEQEEEQPQPIIDFQAIFIPDSCKKVGLITPQLMYHGIEDIILLGTNLWHSSKLIEMAQGYVQGAIMPEGFFVNSPLPKVVDFVENYTNIFGRAPGYLEAQAYDAAWILFEATNTPEVRSRRTLRMALMEINDFPGVTGITSFDETGEAQKDAYLLRIEDDHFIQTRP